MAALSFTKPTVLSGGLGTEIERRDVDIEVHYTQTLQIFLTCNEKILRTP